MRGLGGLGSDFGGGVGDMLAACGELMECCVLWYVLGDLDVV